jgi:hypothetical protein
LSFSHPLITLNEGRVSIGLLFPRWRGLGGGAKLKLIIEVDGITHEHGEIANEDAIRQAKLEEMGFTVIRYTDDEVLTQVNRVRESILSTIEDFA